MSPARSPTQGRGDRQLVSPRKFALVVQPRERQLDHLVATLRQNGFRVAEVSDLDGVLEVIGHTPWLSLLAIDGRIPQTTARRALAAIHDRHPELPILWMDARPDALSPGVPGVTVVAPGRDEVLAKVEELLGQRFYPGFVLEGLGKCAVESFREGFQTDVELLSVSLKLTRATFGKVVPLMSFAGKGVSGHVVLNGDMAVLKSMYKQLFGSSEAPTGEQLGDLGGELLNQIVGRFKAYSTRFGVAFELGLPLVVSGDNLVLRVPRAAPAAVFELAHGFEQVYLEFSLTSMDIAEDAAAAPSDEMDAGALSFL